MARIEFPVSLARDEISLGKGGRWGEGLQALKGEISDRPSPHEPDTIKTGRCCEASPYKGILATNLEAFRSALAGGEPCASGRRAKVSPRSHRPLQDLRPLCAGCVSPN